MRTLWTCRFVSSVPLTTRIFAIRIISLRNVGFRLTRDSQLSHGFYIRVWDKILNNKYSGKNEENSRDPRTKSNIEKSLAVYTPRFIGLKTTVTKKNCFKYILYSK